MLAQARERGALEEVNAPGADIESARTICWQQFPDDAFWNRDEDDVQTSSLWLGPELEDARDQLFDATFQLHRAFIDLNAPYVRHNL